MKLADNTHLTNHSKCANFDALARPNQGQDETMNNWRKSPLSKLADILLSPENRPNVVLDCARLIDDEVAHKSGLTGVAIKGGYKIFKKIKPNVVEEAMDSLLDEFVNKLAPIYDDYLASHKEQPFGTYLGSRGQQIADTLLEITDARGKNSQHKVIKKAYMRLRPMASRQIQDALPAVGRLVTRYAKQS